MPAQVLWRVIDLGLTPYAKVHDLQKSLALELQTEPAGSISNTLLLVEHPPVVTLGRHGGAENLLVSAEFLNSRGVELVQTERGGNITCHFPGQLVAYPIARLLPRKAREDLAGEDTAAAPEGRAPAGVKEFFNDLELIIIRLLARFGLNGEQAPGRSGVWLGDRKICAMGIAVKRWVTYHGLAFNVHDDLSLFELITPCGLPDATVTSLHRELGSDAVGMDAVKMAFLEEFQDYYGLPELKRVACPEEF